MRKAWATWLGLDSKSLDRLIAASAASIVLLLLAPSLVQAQTPDIYRERIRSWSSIAPLPEAAFGERYDLYKGELSFKQEDLRLPGIGPDIVVSRTFQVGGFQQGTYVPTAGTAGFGDWEISIPRMVTKNISGGGFGVGSPTGYFPARDWWNGFQLVDQDGSTRDVMFRSAENTLAPGGATATYTYVTKDNWQFYELPATKNGAGGKAYVGVAPDGTKYWFDWLAYSDGYDGLSKQLPTGKWANALVRKAELLVSQIVDKSGNTLTYTYNGSKLTSITGSDGRVVNFSWTTSGRINGVTVTGNVWTYASGTVATTHSWTYEYSGGNLSRVVYPDGSDMRFNLASLFEVTTDSVTTDCSTTPTMGSIVEGLNSPEGVSASGSITGPSGLIGTFVVKQILKGRSRVTFQCVPATQDQPQEYAFDSPYYVANSLVSRQYSDTRVNISWQYQYDAANASYSNCSSCSTVQKTTVTNPKGEVSRYTYSNEWNAYEGKVMSLEEGVVGSSAMRVTTYQYAPTDGMAYPSTVGSMPFGTYQHVNHLPAITQSPVRSKVVSQQGQTFTWQVDASCNVPVPNTLCFDAYARATKVKRFSDLGFSRTETTAFADKTDPWVLGLVESVTEASTNAKSVENVYDTLGRLQSTKTFGIPDKSYTYNSNGTLVTQADGAGHTTTFSNYKRGLPQDVTFADSTTLHVDVNDFGRIGAYIDQNGYKTCYEYDSFDRLIRTIYPSQSQLGVCSTSGWNPTAISYQKSTTSNYGLPIGNWLLTVTKGSAKTVTYLDGLWRPVMTRIFDAANEANTRKVKVTGYDAAGNVSFESYPQRTADSYPTTGVDSVNITTPGKRTQYDALRRITRVDTDSELGVLPTTMSYQGGFQTVTTNPRNFVSTQSFWALDNPNEAQLRGMVAPEGVNLDISRDVFGTPTAITRSGGGKSVTRSYSYDAGHRLCKTVEPEVGATIQTYDAAGNINWRAPGQTLTTIGSCDDGSVTSGKISYTYDALNRLATTTYSDASPGIGRTYRPDGLPATVISNGSTWTYDYNELRLLKSESFNYGGADYGFTRTYSPNGDLANLSYPSAISLAFNPNALGEPTSVGSYATAIAFHPNGAVSGYTFGNAITHSVGLNLRGLPSLNQDVGIVKDAYTYDPNGNVVGIVDQQESVTTRSMIYDGLDRLTSANTPAVWGNATYGYDALDNITSANVGSRNTTLGYDAGTNLLTTVSVNGTTSIYCYDPRGNIVGKVSGSCNAPTGGRTYSFDLGNRMSGSSLGGSYSYDGEGRRFKVQSTDGSTRLSLYSQSGQLLWSTSTGGSLPASSTAYIYLRAKQIAEWSSANGMQYVHTDALGSPVAHTNPVGGLISRTRFEPYGYIAAGAKPTPGTSQIGFTGHVQDAETDLVYMQQRYYDPIAGRFLSVDPVVTNAQTGKSFGRYTYVDNNPYAKMDPTGMDGCGMWQGTGLCSTLINVNDTGGAPGNRMDPKKLEGFKPIAQIAGEVLQKGLDIYTVILGLATGLEEGTIATKGAITLYRGIASDSPAFINAIKGGAGAQGGAASMLEHIYGNTKSIFTSWTTDYETALKFATNKGTTNGVILTNSFAEGAAFAIPSHIEGIMGESEFLTVQQITDALVTPVK